MSTTTASWLVPVRHPSPDDLELWLERKASRGEILDRVDAWSPLRMRLRKGDAARYRYALERRDTPVPALYFRSRQEMGWEIVGSIGNIHVWRREYAGERPAGFIGEDLGRRAALVGIGLSVVAAIALVAAVALGLVAGLTDFASPADFWIPAVILGVIGVAAGVTALVVGASHRSATIATPEPERDLVRS